MEPGQKWVVEGTADVTFEDSGQACIAEIGGDYTGDDGIFVRFQSWQSGGGREDHPIKDLDGQRVRVEISVVEPGQPMSDAQAWLDSRPDILAAIERLKTDPSSGIRSGRPRRSMNRPPNPNKEAADIIRSGAGVASGHGETGLANRLWAFEERLREEGRGRLADEAALAESRGPEPDLGTLAG